MNPFTHVRPLPRIVGALALALAPLAAAQPTLTLDQAMAHPDWIGPPVEQAWWSLDGQSALYTLKREGSPVRDTWRIGLDGGSGARVADEDLHATDARGAVFDATRSRAAFIRNGDVFVRDLRNGVLTPVTRGGASASDLRFTTDGGLAWREGSDWRHADARSGLVALALSLKAEKDPEAEPEPDALREMQLRLIDTLARERADREALRERERELRAADPLRAPRPVHLGDEVTLAGSSLSPSLRHALVVTEAKNANRGQRGQMPRYVTESGYEDTEEVRTRVGRNDPVPQTLHLVDVRDGSVRALSFDVLPGIGSDPLADLRAAAGKDPLSGNRPVRVLGMRFSDDGSRAAVMLRSVDNKDRWIAEVDFDAGRLLPRHRLTDPAWINWAFNDFGWLPDNRTLWFQSEESGFGHLYTLQAGDRPQALTSGRWEAADPVLSGDGSRFVFRCNREWPGAWEVCERPLGRGEVRELTRAGHVDGFELSPDGSRLLLRVSSAHMPPQLAVAPGEGGAHQQLTDTRSADFRAFDWLEPEFVRVPSNHGAGEVWSKLYLPRDMEPGRRYPIALFVHGAGYLQNVHAGWPVYFREQMFHQLLTEAGYVVLDMDFRASSGYGRDWRTAIYRQMGHPELEDYLDGIDYLVANHQGDRDRVGIYGGSYGGFMAFMAMFREPGRFHAGAALRPVTDWAMYNHPYTSNILNTPELDPEAYRRSSPIEHVENLQGHLLISHGMIDDNVFYQDSIRLVQRLIELKKHDWELASYPLERHAYQHPESWYDQYRRIFELFERALKP